MLTATEKQQRVEELARFFVSTVQFDRTLLAQFPKLANYLKAKWRSDAEERLAKALKVVISGAPTVDEIMTSDHSNPGLRKTLRDRFLKQATEAFDNHFPRPGGRSAAPLAAHEAAMAKLSGATWQTISAKPGDQGEEDRARKLVARNRKTLTDACSYLLDRCGPDSNAPQEVKTEFEALMSRALYNPSKS